MFLNTLAYLVKPSLLCYLCLQNCQLLNKLLWERCLLSILLTECKRKWRGSFVLSESCNKKGNIQFKSRLFPSGFSQGIQWARSVSQGPEELSLDTWITLLKLNSNLLKYKSLSLHEVNKPSTESLWILSQHLSGSMSPTRSLLVTLCKPALK